MSGLAGKVVLVTGAARRIGRGIALHLAAEGARVAIHYHRSEDEARLAAEQCGAVLFRANLESVAEIAIIPFTYTHTNLRDRVPGDAVNLECDILAKYVESLLEGRKQPAVSRLTVGQLTEQGF
jgi:NAD(P)-dependent dehydrogenase (short-subunit alcohol dehydrogenase family)